MEMNLSDRERKHFAAAFNELSVAADNVAKSLEQKDDTMAMASWIILSVTGGTIIKAFGETIKEAISEEAESLEDKS